MGQDLTRRGTNALEDLSRPLPLPIVDAGQLDRAGRNIQCAEHGRGPARETTRPRQWWCGELSECPSGKQHGVRTEEDLVSPAHGSSGHARVERSDPSVLTRTHYVLLIKDRNTKNSVVGDKTGGF